MKNFKKLPAREIFRVPVQGLPPLKGRAIRYLSGLEGESQNKAGDFMSQWQSNDEGLTFVFESGLHMCFTDEKLANEISSFLRKQAEIETEVVKIGNP